MEATSIQRSPSCGFHGGRRRASSGTPACAQASAALRDITAAKGCVASTTASIRSCARKRASPSTPPKPPMRVGIGNGRGSLVRPAMDRRGLKSELPVRSAASAEASVVPPRMRMRMGPFSLNSESESSMATTAPWLTIIGIGEDGRAGLSPPPSPPSTGRTSSSAARAISRLRRLCPRRRRPGRAPSRRAIR